MVEWEGFGTLICNYENADFSAVVYVHLVDHPIKNGAGRHPSKEAPLPYIFLLAIVNVQSVLSHWTRDHLHFNLELHGWTRLLPSQLRLNFDERISQPLMVMPSGFEPENAAVKGLWVKPLLHGTKNLLFTEWSGFRVPADLFQVS